MYEDSREIFLRKAESCRPQIYQETIKPVSGVPSVPLNRGDRAVIDFGGHYVGRVKLLCSYTGRHPDAPAFIKVKFCEVSREIDEDSGAYEGWISKSWIQEEWLHIDVLPSQTALPRRYAFRYAVIEVIDVSDKFSLVIDGIEARTYTSAEDSANVPCIRPKQRLEAVSIRTLRSCMQDVFEDGPKRDRRLWIGDLRLQALSNYVTFRKNDLVKRCLYLFAGTADDDGRVRACLFTEPEIEGDDTYMFDYSLFFIPVLLDYYEASQDTETAEELFKTARRQLEISRSYFDDNHLIRDSDELGWCFLDWNLELNKQAGAQAVYIYCEKAMIRLMKLLGKTNGLSGMEQDAERKIQAAKQYLYDGKKGLFVSGADRQISYASQVWAVLAGIFDAGTNREILDGIQKTQDAVHMVTPYMYHHYVEALLMCGDREGAYRVLTDYWGAMLKDGADTFYELFNPKNPDESPYGSPVVNSYCHAWSCTPVYFIRRYHLTGDEVKRSTIKGFIFDLDGVIVSTDRLHYEAWKRIADQLGIVFHDGINNRLRGVSRMESLEIILERYHGKPLSREEKEKLASAKNTYYCELLKTMTPSDVPDDVRETLARLRKQGYLLAIGSSSKNAKTILKQVDLTAAFDAVSDGTNISRSKPDPEVFLKAAGYLHLKPGECAVIEDARAGIDAAKAAGMTAIATGDAKNYEKADIILKSFGDLIR